jgi:hypothetical protein
MISPDELVQHEGVRIGSSAGVGLGVVTDVGEALGEAD